MAEATGRAGAKERGCASRTGAIGAGHNAGMGGRRRTAGVDGGMVRPYRVGIATWVARLSVVWMCAVAPLVVLATLLSETLADGTPFPLHQRLLSSAAVVVTLGGLGWAIWRQSRLGVYLTTGGVAVVRFLGTTRYPWSEIAGFDAISPREGRRGFLRFLLSRKPRTVRILLVDGREHRVNIIDTIWPGTKAAEIVRRLEAARPLCRGNEP